VASTPTGLIKGHQIGASKHSAPSLCAGERMITVMTYFGGVGMASSGVRSPVDQQWKVLYRAAIFETDKAVLRTRLSDAEEAVIARGRELLHATGDTIEEREALEDALYALRAFRNAWQQNSA
jgi:hypothetical protein